jgi:hypothetical protein
MTKENKPLVSSGGKNRFFHLLTLPSLKFVPSPVDISPNGKPFLINCSLVSFISFVPRTIPISPSPFSLIEWFTRAAPSPSP